MQFNHISYPVLLDTWRINNFGPDLQAFYDEWNGNEPFAGGYALAVFDSGNGTNQWNIWWLGGNQFALQSADAQGLYAWIDGGFKYGAILALTNGSDGDDLQPNRSYDPHGRYTLVNLSNGSVAILSNGQPLSFRHDARWMDQGFNIVGTANIIQAWETLNIPQGSHFTILLITESGQGLNLAYHDLAAGAYIASIEATDFSHANLSRANFSNLPTHSLAQCNFTSATLSGATLKGCQNLNQAIWAQANLSNTDLSEVDGAGTANIDFSGATLTGATLSNGRPLFSNYNYSGSKFVGAHLDGAHLSNVSFVGTDFTGATLTGANLDGADLTGAILVNADLTGASLKGTLFTDTQLAGTKFNHCDLSGALFSPSPAFGRSTTNRTQFQNAVNLPVAKLGLDWSYLDLTGAMLTEIVHDLSNLNAQYTLFPDRVPFSGIKLTDAHFENAQMFYAMLNQADLGGATFDNTLLKGATLTSANLSQASLQNAWLIAEGSDNDPNKYEAAKLSDAFLINTVMDGAHCDGVDFSGTLFLTYAGLSNTPASANGAFMNRSTFVDAVILGVSFRGTQFAGAHFDNAILINSTFPSAQIIPTSDSVNSVPTMHNAKICGAQFADVTEGGTSNPANMDGLEMQGSQYSTISGTFKSTDYKDYYGNVIPLFVDFGPTVLGTTGSSTTCPDGSPGSCSLTASGSSLCDCP